MNPLHVNSWDLYSYFLDTVKCRVALDIGANDGGYTKTLLENGFIVHAFEPVPEMFEKLKGVHGGDAFAILNNLGVSDRAGVVKDITVLEAWTIGNPGLGGLQVKPERRGVPTFDMTTTTVDEYLQGDPVGIIKLDVDGYEPNVLRGAIKTLKQYRPPILCEISNYIEKLGTPAKDFCELVFGLGYRMVSMDGKYEAKNWHDVEPWWPHHSSFDVMLVPNEVGWLMLR